MGEDNKISKNELFGWVEYVGEHFDGYVGIERDKEYFYKCLNKVRALMEEHAELNFQLY